MNLHFCEVTASDWRAVTALNVAKEQQQFIESDAFFGLNHYMRKKELL